jgi:exopolyphosphatase/guanosine-5'-triphosphate,3'-diphosphate pyrophosphatase
MKLATIDIGTNTTLLLVAEGSGPADVRALEEHAEITRLGRGIGKDGGLSPEAVARTLAVLEAYAGIARAHGAPVAAIGTEALRRAPNADEFLQPAARILGAPVEVIGGEREAALTYRAAVTSFPEVASGPLVVIDIGGGSTEVIVAEGGDIRLRDSLPLGSVRFTEKYIHNDPALTSEVAAVSTGIESALAAVPARSVDGHPYQLVGTAGTVTTLAAMAQDLASWDPARVHGYRLKRMDLEAQIERLARSNQREREQMAGLDPRRADVILAGACILAAFVRRLDAPYVLVNDRGIRWGLLYEKLVEAHG